MLTKTKFDLKPGMATREAFGRTLAALGKENLLKIIEGLLVICLRTNQRIRIEPQQLAFLVVILAAPPV